MTPHHTEGTRYSELVATDATPHVYEKAMLVVTFQRSVLSYDAINWSVFYC